MASHTRSQSRHVGCRPFTAYLERQDRYNRVTADVLHRLTRLAEQLECAVIVKKHMSTTRTSVVPVERIAGPGSWSDIPRTIIFVGRNLA